MTREELEDAVAEADDPERWILVEASTAVAWLTIVAVGLVSVLSGAARVVTPHLDPRLGPLTTGVLTTVLAAAISTRHAGFLLHPRRGRRPDLAALRARLSLWLDLERAELDWDRRRACAADLVAWDAGRQRIRRLAERVCRQEPVTSQDLAFMLDENDAIGWTRLAPIRLPPSVEAAIVGMPTTIPGLALVTGGRAVRGATWWLLGLGPVIFEAISSAAAFYQPHLGTPTSWLAVAAALGATYGVRADRADPWWSPLASLGDPRHALAVRATRALDYNRYVEDWNAGIDNGTHPLAYRLDYERAIRRDVIRLAALLEELGPLGDLGKADAIAFEQRTGVRVLPPDPLGSPRPRHGAVACQAGSGVRDRSE